MAAKRERLDIRSDRRYVRRDARGRFTSDQSDVGRSSAVDQQRRAQHEAPRGQGDRGDRRDGSSRGR